MLLNYIDVVGETASSSDDDWRETVGELRHLFPLSLSPEAVLCDCAWEAASAWHREPDGVDRLIQALELLAFVDHPALRHGIAFLMWDTLVQSRFRFVYCFDDFVSTTTLCDRV